MGSKARYYCTWKVSSCRTSQRARAASLAEMVGTSDRGMLAAVEVRSGSISTAPVRGFLPRHGRMCPRALRTSLCVGTSWLNLRPTGASEANFCAKFTPQAFPKAPASLDQRPLGRLWPAIPGLRLFRHRYQPVALVGGKEVAHLVGVRLGVRLSVGMRVRVRVRVRRRGGSGAP